MERSVRLAWLIGPFVLAFLGWTVFILASAASGGVWPDHLDFSRLGQFGDAFGSFSAAMAGAAAIFTGATYWATRAENVRLRDEQTRREADAKFYRLLDLRSRVVAGLALIESEADMDAQGLEALHLMAEVLRGAVHGAEDPRAGYEQGFHPHRHALGHYFRFTYHLVVTVLETFDDEDDRYHYLCLLRGQMTNAEYVLLALNCAYGRGRGEFQALVEGYALLHNIDPRDREALGLDRLYAPGAFEWARRGRLGTAQA